jgi:hypothetical protein
MPRYVVSDKVQSFRFNRKTFCQGETIELTVEQAERFGGNFLVKQPDVKCVDADSFSESEFASGFSVENNKVIDVVEEATITPETVDKPKKGKKEGKRRGKGVK